MTQAEETLAAAAPAALAGQRAELAQFVLLGAIWGSSFLFMRIATVEFGVLPMAAVRVFIAAACLLPMLAWYWGFAGTGYQGPVANPHAMASRPVQLVVFGLWVAGVVALAAGLSLELAAMIRSAAAALLVATVLDALNVARILRHAYAPSSAHSSKESS